jgi:hypothetical protein
MEAALSDAAATTAGSVDSAAAASESAAPMSAWRDWLAEFVPRVAQYITQANALTAVMGGLYADAVPGLPIARHVQRLLNRQIEADCDDSASPSEWQDAADWDDSASSSASVHVVEDAQSVADADAHT